MNKKNEVEQYRKSWREGFKNPLPTYPQVASSGYDEVVGLTHNLRKALNTVPLIGYNAKMTERWKDQEKEWISLDSLYTE